MSMIVKIIFAVLLFWVGITAAAYFFQHRLLYFPSRNLACTPAAADLVFEDVYFKTEDGIQLHGWYIPAQKARATVLFCHGNGGNISHRLESILVFNRLGLNVFIFDYRGYGLSRGRPSEQGTELDALAAWHWLKEEKQVDCKRLVVFGRSLGGAVAAGLAGTRTAASLILESSFTSYSDIGREHYPWLPVRLIARYRYATIDMVRNLDMPVLVVHSPDDRLVPFQHGRELYAACAGQKYFLEISGGHNDGFLLSGDSYVQGLDRFITAVVP